MIKKELRSMIKSPSYYVILLLPIALCLFMSEGTKNYLEIGSALSKSVETTVPVRIYQGARAGAKLQFAVSELSFMLLMASLPMGFNVFEERRLHTWDRLVNKSKLLYTKWGLHYLYTLLMIAISVIGFRWIFAIHLSPTAILLFATIPILSLSLGLMIACCVESRSVLQDTTLMLVMLLGFFGGALSLSSVLSNTRVMNLLMYLSPLTLVNQIIFADYLALPIKGLLLPWLLVEFVLSAACLAITRRRIKHGIIL
ncbi:MAG: hypothetical protein Q4P72_04385 [Eubacteriales bacterium]|nr:hypothetical protein [Eubacteriales bacterium]